MICECCNKREANVHITKIINGKMNEMHLCEECAREKNEIHSPLSFGMPLSFQSILEGFFDIPGAKEAVVKREEECPICHRSFEDFKKTGRLGCSTCYSTFKGSMIPLIRRIHGNIQHIGKIPGRTGGELKALKELRRLKDELREAVEKEEYEKAASLRDMIRDMEKKTSGKENGEVK